MTAARHFLRRLLLVTGAFSSVFGLIWGERSQDPGPLIRVTFYWTTVQLFIHAFAFAFAAVSPTPKASKPTRNSSFVDLALGVALVVTSGVTASFWYRWFVNPNAVVGRIAGIASYSPVLCHIQHTVPFATSALVAVMFPAATLPAFLIETWIAVAVEMAYFAWLVVGVLHLGLWRRPYPFMNRFHTPSDWVLFVVSNSGLQVVVCVVVRLLLRSFRSIIVARGGQKSKLP